MKFFSQKKMFFMSLAVLFLFFCTNSWAATYKHIVAFGDSLSDNGGLSSYNSIIVANGGQGAPGSWTNNGATPYGGDVWLDYLKNKWGATLDNNAIGGAMTLGHENSGIQALIDASLLPDLGLTGQITTYLSSSPTYDVNKTIFAIWIGGNDCLEFFRGEYYTSDPNALIVDSVGRIITQIGSLYADGARNFMVLNLPDLSKTPAFNTQDAITQANVAGVVNNFNAALASALSGFTSAHTDAELFAIDAFSKMNEIISDDIFEDSTASYLKVDENCDWDFASFNGTYDQFLFFDCIHPTTKAHELVANEVNDIVPDDDDDDDNCFISASNAPFSHSQPVMLITGIFLIIGFAGFFIKKNS